MAHTTDWKAEGLIRVFTGEITPDEILKSNLKIYDHPNFSAIKYIINDFTGVTSIDVEKEHTRIYASTDDIISNTKGKLLVAIVATQNEHIALAKNYQKEMKNNLFVSKIFNTIDDAQKWVASK